MSKRTRVQYCLDSGTITGLPKEEIKVILRAAEELITTGGRTMLVKILKGSKDKKLLEYKLDQCPSYGFYHLLTMEEIGYRVDFVICHHYLRIEYNYSFPVLVFTDKGWEIERETYTDEWFCRFSDVVKTKILRLDLFREVKTVNREVVFGILERIRKTGDPEYIPLLKVWQSDEVRKVRDRIESVLRTLGDEPGEV